MVQCSGFRRDLVRARYSAPLRLGDRDFAVTLYGRDRWRPCALGARTGRRYPAAEPCGSGSVAHQISPRCITSLLYPAPRQLRRRLARARAAEDSADRPAACRRGARARRQLAAADRGRVYPQACRNSPTLGAPAVTRMSYPASPLHSYCSSPQAMILCRSRLGCAAPTGERAGRYGNRRRSGDNRQCKGHKRRSKGGRCQRNGENCRGRGAGMVEERRKLPR